MIRFSLFKCSGPTDLRRPFEDFIPHILISVSPSFQKWILAEYYRLKANNRNIMKQIKTITATDSHLLPKLKKPSPFLDPFFVFSEDEALVAFPFLLEFPPAIESSCWMSFLSSEFNRVGIFTCTVTK